MKKSRVLTLGLACFFTAVTAFSAVAATSGGGGALLSHKNDSSRTQTAQQFSQTDEKSAPNAQNGSLNLDPQTDETIYTTDDGLEIKQHNIVASGSYTKLQYFTLGSYNGTPVNWIILAFNPTVFLTDSTPAGTAIKNDTSKQVMMAQTNTSLGTNQLLCISQYAFNQTTMTITVSAHAEYYFSGYTQHTEGYAYASDQISDYYASAPTLSLSNANIDSNCLNLGTTFGINGLYGSKIVKNTSFNSNYVFNLTASQYASYVGSTGYKIPYLFTSTSTSTNLFVPTSATMTHTVTATHTYKRDYASVLQHVTGTGKANTTVPILNTAGNSANFTLANYTAKSRDKGEDEYYKYSYSTQTTYYAHAYITYSVSTSNLTAAYRPAFIYQL